MKMKVPITIDSRINTDTANHEYRARLNANYNLVVSSEVVQSTSTWDLQNSIETELKIGLSNVVYGDIVKEMRHVIEVYSELKSIKTREHSDFLLLREQIKKLEETTNKIMNLCVFE